MQGDAWKVMQDKNWTLYTAHYPHTLVMQDKTSALYTVNQPHILATELFIFALKTVLIYMKHKKNSTQNQKSEVGICKRKQENRLSTKKAIKLKK